MWDKNGQLYRDCVVGNVIDKNYWGEKKQLRSGTKHFRPGAKLYCVFVFGGGGHEFVRVLGKPRKSFRMIDIVFPTNYIKNFRLAKVYEPRIIDFIDKYEAVDNTESIARYMFESLNKSHAEIVTGEGKDRLMDNE